MRFAFLLAVLFPPTNAAAQVTPPAAPSQPLVHYRLTVDSADTTGFAVEMRVRNAPDTFTVAMAAHPEYDDRYWRFVDGLTISPPSTIALLDSSRWLGQFGGEDAAHLQPVLLAMAPVNAPGPDARGMILIRELVQDPVYQLK